MNKIQNITLLIFIISFSILNNLKSQCVVCIEAPPANYLWRISHCWERVISPQHIQMILITGIIPLLHRLMKNVSNGGTTNSNCTSSPTNTSSCAGAASGGDFLWFPQGSTVPRVARTIQMAVPAGGTIFFEFKMEAQSAPGCDGPDQVNEGVFLQYNVGAGWQDLPANQAPFSSNPMHIQMKFYFIPPETEIHYANT